MEIIIKLDHDEVTNVKTSSTKNREGDQSIEYRDDQLYHLRTQRDELRMKLQNKDDEIQDLKLENDRLKQREEIMLHFIKSCACMYSCQECNIKNKVGLCHYIELLDSRTTGSRMTDTAKAILSRLEAL